jgi:hypothetical protein
MTLRLTKRLDFTAIETAFINKLVTGKIFDIFLIRNSFLWVEVLETQSCISQSL